MNRLLQNIKTTFLGGILFLVPLVVLVIFIEKGHAIIEKISAPIVHNFPKIKILGLALQELATIVVVIFICFLVGLIAKTQQAQKIKQKLEDGLLSNIPGYSFMKNVNETMMGFESKEDLKVVLVPTDAGWQFAFLVEQINENNFAVFVPDAPNPWSGSVCFVNAKDIKEVEISQKEALACIRKLGYGAKDLLKDTL
ncbi:DUF502 domain-containing protein [Flavobacterium sp. GA093]|uniref:DUF502 domain-containing protein n=1 Tax=Flavobacterium hydrocarbonoxydans TaxID=2683249 RepID=A0A6I4NJX7_9FLAO|nr:DUF502 domain-containing protein [Flavobacterium hydrocarbonoxydans]MWB94303.1 DUF502 domain-containing protein [Flavobacterium hydrocarbonoxydans]